MSAPRSTVVITRDKPLKINSERSQLEEKNYQDRDIKIVDKNEEKLIQNMSTLVRVDMGNWGEVKEKKSVIFTNAVANCIAIIAYNEDKHHATLAHFNGAEAGYGDEEDPVNNTNIVFSKLSSIIQALIDKVKVNINDNISVILFKGSSFTKGKDLDDSDEIITENFYDFFIDKVKDDKSIHIINLMDTDSLIGPMYSGVLFNPVGGSLHIISDNKKDFFQSVIKINPTLQIERAKNEIDHLLIPPPLEKVNEVDVTKMRSSIFYNEKTDLKIEGPNLDELLDPFSVSALRDKTIVEKDSSDEKVDLKKENPALAEEAWDAFSDTEDDMELPKDAGLSGKDDDVEQKSASNKKLKMPKH